MQSTKVLMMLTVQAYQDALDKVKAKASVRKVLKAKHDFVPATKAESLFR